MKIIKQLKRVGYIFLPILGFLISSPMVYAAMTEAQTKKASNQFEAYITLGLAKISEAFFSFLGKLLTTLIEVLIKFATYNNFVTAPAVENGWVIVRDFCNMFFIVILLIIAFATILRIDSYNIKKQLPKLIVMAILINFSKTISGLLIDISQVVMLTFVSAFSALAGPNFTELLGISELTDIDTSGKIDVSSLAVLGAFLLALLYILISMIVLLVIIATLVVRIVMLWIYVTLSPLAYLLAAFPQGKGYSAQWWDEFSKQLIIGPILAFFVWLSFYAATISPATGLLGAGYDNTKGFKVDQLGKNTNTEAAITKAGGSDHMIKFIISIGMLLGGLQVAQKMGGVGGRAAGKGMGKIMGGAAIGMALAKKTGKGTAKFAGRKVVADPLRTVRDKGMQRVGGLVAKGAGEGSFRGAAGQFMNKWGSEMTKGRKKARTDARLKTLEKFGIKGEAQEALKSTLETDGAKTLASIGQSVAMLGATVATAGAASPLMGIAGAAGLGQIWRSFKGTRTYKDKIVGDDKKTKDATIKTAETDRDTKLSEAEEKRKNTSEEKQKSHDIESIDNTLKIELANIDVLHKNGTIDDTTAVSHRTNAFNNHKTQKDTIDARYKAIEEHAQKEYQESVSRINQEFDTTKKTADDQYRVVEDKFNERWGVKYNANQLTVEALAKGTKDRQVADKKVKVLANGESLFNFKKSDFYSASGQTDVQKKMFDSLASGTEHSAKAIEQMVSFLKKTSVGKMSDADKGLVVSLKKGFAAYDRGGNDTSKFNDIISELNNINTGETDDKGDVSNFKESVIEN